MNRSAVPEPDHGAAITENGSQRKSCDPRLSGRQPTEKWSVEELGKFAQAWHQQIEAGEQSLALAYWRLGLALNLARRQFAHGQWGKFLDELGIDKTRASQARAIQRSFETEQSVEGLSVQEAYRRRKRKPRRPLPTKRRKRSDQKNSMVDWLLDICKKADSYLAEVDFDNSKESSSLLPVIETAVEELTRLRNQLRQRIEAK